MIRAFACLFSSLMMLMSVNSPALGQGLFGQKTDYASVYLHSGRMVEDGRRLTALRMELKPGWKTYWRNPGDAGIPPHFDWAGSTNLKAVSIEWPTPVVFDTYGSRTIGYEERMVLPLMLTPEDPAKPISIRLNFSYGLCSDICIPAQQDIAMEISPDAAEDGGYFLDRAAATAPLNAEEGGLIAHECKVEGAGEKRRFVAELSLQAPLISALVIVVEGPEGVWFGPVVTSVLNGKLIAEGPVETEAGLWIDRSLLSVTVLGPERAVSLDGCFAAG
ncbi:MAG: protein-disulfide reductase DsbD family protein [Paracoccaceae bacterium]|jgi:DsbC/DsbD-like thiol-disulfide interchange protein|nr:protein-disulfide reductase DsbD family protein [Paracoccaceae bacterium]